MLVENLSQSAANEAYILLSAYLREDGKVQPNYNKEHLKEFVKFLQGIINDPHNWPIVTVEDTGNSPTIPV